MTLYSNPFKPGDLVALACNAPDNMSPSKLVKEGHKNLFHVMFARQPTMEALPYGSISLKECCFSNHRRDFNCSGHPSQYFELLFRDE